MLCWKSRNSATSLLSSAAPRFRGTYLIPQFSAARLQEFGFQTATKSVWIARSKIAAEWHWGLLFSFCGSRSICAELRQQPPNHLVQLLQQAWKGLLLFVDLHDSTDTRSLCSLLKRESTVWSLSTDSLLVSMCFPLQYLLSALGS